MGESVCHYDVVIAGAGCAGLSLAVRIARSQALSSWNILLLDQAPKSVNDRTWCFWEAQPGYFESIVSHRWDKADFYTKQQQLSLSFSPFAYKMIQSKDFYAYTSQALQQAKQFHPQRKIDIWYEQITDIQDRDTYAEVHTSQHLIHARYVFSSLPRAIPRDKNTHFLWQHFRGWFIRTSSPAFDASRMVLMDFRVPQQQATAFMYILPTSTREALMEYTVFSGELLASDKYDACIQDYLQTHYPGLDYVITEKEQGKIPMTDYAFPQQGERVIFIGTAGGQTKASTGYTFPFIQSHADAIVQALEQNASPAVYHAPRERFYRYYDRLLLHVLSELQFPGDELFAILFGKNPTDMVIRFLSQQSSFLDDLSIILSLPKRPFLQAAIHEWKALIKQS